MGSGPAPNTYTLHDSMTDSPNGDPRYNPYRTKGLRNIFFGTESKTDAFTKYKVKLTSVKQ